MSAEDRILDILSDPYPANPELVRKLAYVERELAKPARATDHAFLLTIRKSLLREARR